MRIAPDGWVYVGGAAAGAVATSALAAFVGRTGLTPSILTFGGFLAALMAFFFRDPRRSIPDEPGVIVAGADGVIRSVEELDEKAYLGTRVVRVSTFLSILDVHVNRAPMAGEVRRVDHRPGRKVLAYRAKASEVNEHSAIVIAGPQFSCLVRQIVGPVARRVVTWVRQGDQVLGGDRIGLMKFGSRLDVCLPADRVEVLVRRGQRVRAGVTVIARLREPGGG